MSGRTAVVVPAAPHQPPRTVTWTGSGLLDLLYREIATDSVDHGSFGTPFGGVAMWVADNGLISGPIEHNDRAIAICRTFGYQIPDVGGAAVFTGGADENGDTLSIPDEFRSGIETFCDAVKTAGWTS